MGLLSWLFPSPADRVAKARRYLELGRPDEARLELLEVDHPEAAQVLKAAETELAVKNLETAIGYARAGDEARVHIHLELAEQFHHGGLEDRFRDARREMREIRAERGSAAEREKAKAEARLLQDHHGGAVDALLEEEREELEQRLALVVENYPEALRASVGELGAEFARAVLDLEDGRPDLALQALLALPDDAPLVQWERARAAHALGDPVAAARAVRAFAQHAHGHHPMGRVHSGTYLAQLLVEGGDAHGALRAMRDVRAASPGEGGFLFAQLLTITGALQEAEQVTKALIKQSPKAMPLYGLLARVRVAGGHRTEAMRALEAGMEATHCPPGKCGYQPPDLDAHRLLATLYLEDGLETERALELAATAASLVQRPAWDDVYLQGLVARAQGAPEAQRIGEALLAQTPDGDPRVERARALLTG